MIASFAYSNRFVWYTCVHDMTTCLVGIYATVAVVSAVAISIAFSSFD